MSSNRFRRTDAPSFSSLQHDHETVEAPAMALTRLAQSRFERPRRTGGAKHVAAVIATVDHVVTRAGILHSKSTGHPMPFHPVDPPWPVPNPPILQHENQLSAA